MAGLWDAHLKSLMVYAAQDYLSWLIGDAIIDEEFPPHLDEELSPHLLRQISADSFYGFHIGSRKYAMHLEFQSCRDSKMARRLWEYNVIASCKFKRPVYSIVLFLKKDAVNTASPYIVRDHTGLEIHRFQFTIVKLWELPTEMVFEKRFQGLLPLAPLTRDGQRHDVVEKMFDSLLHDNADKELLLLSYGLSSLAFEETDDKEWLKRRFRMLDEILRDTWAFKELRQRGEEAGLKEGLKEGLKRDLNILSSFVQARFPVLMPMVEECRQMITEPELLQQLVIDVGLAQSEDDARRYLKMALAK